MYYIIIVYVRHCNSTCMGGNRRIEMNGWTFHNIIRTTIDVDYNCCVVIL